MKELSSTERRDKVMGTEIYSDSIAEFGTELKGFFSSRNVVEFNTDFVSIVGAKTL